MAVGAQAAAAVVLVVALNNHGSAGAATVYADYSALDSTAPSGIAIVSSRKEAEAATGPVWMGRNSAGAVEPEIAAARPVAVGVPGLRAWAARSTAGGICILAYASAPPGESRPGGLGVSCDSNGGWAHGATMEMTVGGSKPYLVGLAPNDVSSVTLRLDNGGSTTLPVSHNVYATPISDAASSVVFTTAGAQQTVNLGGR